MAILVFRNSEAGYTEAETESKNLNIKEEQGVATAAYSMMLQAHAMGIASGWICSPLYIKNELQEISKKYGKPRFTEIIHEENIKEITTFNLIEEYNLKLFLTKHNYLKKIPLTSLRANLEQKIKEDDI